MHGHENTYRLTNNCRGGGVHAIALRILTVLILFLITGFNNLQAQITLTQSASTSCSNINVVFTATITPDPVTGAIDFYDGTTLLGSATLNAGKAIFYINNLSSGSHSITAKYLLIQSNVITHTVNPAINPGTIDVTGGARCPDGNPGAINSLTPASGGNGGLVYTWQTSTDNGITWTNTGITTDSYDPGPITQTTQYRRMVYDGCGTMAYSAVSQYTVYPEAVSQTIIASPNLIYTCSGTDGITCSGSICAGVGVSATFSGGTTGIPGRTDYDDIYEVSINGGTWTSYTPGEVISTSNFSTAGTVSIRTRREPNYTSLGCNYGKYNIVTWTVNPIPTLSSSLNAARTSSSNFIYDPQSSVTGTSFSWSRDAVAGISNASASGTGSISETLINTTHNPIDVTYHYVLNANGCSNTQDIVLSIAGANAFQYNVSSTGGVCEGSGTTIILSGSENGFSYQLKKDGVNVGSPIPGNGSTLNFPVQSTIGTYTVVASDGTDMIGSVTIYPLPNATIESQTNVNCFGGSTGAVNLTVTGGTSPYTYSWSNGATTEDLTGLAAGTYNVTITDSKGCTTTASATISQPAAALSASTTKTDVNCFGGSTGAVNLTVTGGTSPYTYSWSNGATTEDLTGLAAGTYNVTITDSKGCTTTASATISQPAAALSASTTKTDVNCFGGSTGAVNLTVTGGTSPYTYSWSNGATTEDLTGLAAGTYNVTITDSKGCTTTASATISQPAAALSASTTKTDVNCFGGSTGAVNLTVTGGTSPYTYSWSNGATTEDLTGLAAGTYNVTITDSKGCTTTASATISQPAAALSASTTKTDVNCFGGSTGAVNLTVTGGTSPYTFSWSNGATTEDLTGLAAGTYNVTVTDSKGCTTTASATVGQPAAALSASTTKTDVNCFGGSTGAVNLTVTGGTSPYTFSWSNGATTEDLTGLAAGTYNVTVTDSKGCTTTASATVGQPAAALTITSIGSNAPICAGSTVNFNSSASGGTGAITYSWTGPGGFTANVQNPSRASITTAQGGTYNLTVNDANGCTANASTDVTVIPTVTPSVFISANPGNNICQGTSVTFTATPTNGGTKPSYQWQVNGNNVGTNSPTFSSSSFVNGDKVTVILTSNAACPLPASVTSSVVTMTVNDLVTPSVTISPSTNNICPGTTVTFTTTTINGGSSPTYQWQVNGSNVGTNSPTFSSSTLNNNDVVSVTVTSNAPCASPATASSSVTMTVKPVPVPAVSIAASTNNICPGTSVTFTASPTNGGTSPTYQWQVNGVNAGTNSSTFTSTTLNNNDVVKVILTSNASCASPTTATSTSIIMVVNPGTPAKPGAITGNTTVCPGTTGINYSIAAVPNATNYTWIVPVGWTITNGQGTTTITVTAGTSGQNGNINVTASNSCGTSAANTLPVTVNSGTPATPGIITGSNEQCINKTGLSYSITAVPNATSYTWSVPAGWTITSGQGSTSITVSTSATASSGNISVTAINSCGTSNAQTLAVIASTAPPATPATPSPAVGQANSICPVATGLVYSIPAVAGATNYTWNVPTGWTITSGQGSTSITVTAGVQTTGNKNISVTASNACGSATSSNLVVTVGTFASVDAGLDQSVCAGTPSINLAATVAGATNAANDLTWSAPSGSFSNSTKANTSFTIPASILSGGTITITVTARSEGSCPSVSDQMILTVLPNPTSSISGSTTICSGNSSTITFTGTANTTVTYKINGGADQTINIGASGNGTLNTGNLTATTSYTLVSVGYSAAPTCSQAVSGTATITVKPLPTVNAGTYSPVCEGSASITLNGTPAGGSFSGTGVTGNSFNPTTAGSYTIAYNYTDPSTGCSNSATTTITVNARPSLTITNPAAVCSPSTVNLTAAAVTTGSNLQGGTLSYWLDANATSSLTTPNAVVTSGTYYIKVTTASGCSDIKPVVVTINQAATVSAGPNQTICSNATATMAGSIGGGATSGTWSTSGSGSFSNNTPTAVYTPSAADINAGSVTLTYTTDDPAGPCGPVSANTIITIKKAVVITTQPSNTSVCAGLPADLTVQAIGEGLTYQWYKGTAPGGTAVSNSSNISGAQAANLHFNQAALSDDGNYYVVVSGASPCAPVTSAQRTLNVDQAINITTQPVSQTLCSGSNVSFNVVADANGDPLSYQWRKNGVNIAGQTSAILTLNNISSADAGSYDVVITGPAGYTCSSTISSKATLTVNLPSTINLTSGAGTNAQTKCVSNAITPITYTVGGGGTGASITSGALPAGVTGTYSNGVFTISGIPTATGSFNYTVTTTGPCTNVTATGTITVNDNSTLVLTSNNATQPVCANGSITPITYNVGGGATGVTVSGLPGGVIGSLNSGVYTISGNPTVPGTYPFTVTTTGPCVNLTLNGTITVNPNSTLTLTSPSANQNLCINSVPTNIVYTAGGGATGATVTGLPPGMTGTYNNGTITISNTPTAAGSYNYTVTTTGNCNNVTLGGTITVNPAPIGGTTSPSITTVCGSTNSGTINLTGQSGTIIRWESSTNGGGTWTPISNTSTTLSYLNLPQTTIFRAVIQSGVCPLAFSTNAVVSMVPATTPIANASPTSICLGQPATLGATANIPQTWADIDATFNQANPAGWRITYNGTVINFPANADNASTFPWSETNGPKTPFNGGVTYDNFPRPPLGNDKFAIASGAVNTTMETPVFSTIGMTSATLQFYQALVFAAGASGKIEISTDGGATYNQTLVQYNGPLNIGNPSSNWDPLNIDLSNYMGLSNLRIRFTYAGVNNSNWALDGLKLQPPGPTLTYNWTLTDPPGVPTPYYLNVTNRDTVIATPPAPGTYTYQVATTIGGCPGGTANVVVTVKPLPTCNIAGPTTVCPGASAVFSGPTTSGYTYKWTITGGGTISGSTTSQTVTVIANNSCGNYTLSLITTVNGCSSTPCTYLVNVVDIVKPIITLAPAGTVNCNATPADVAAAFGTASVTDNCSTGLTATGTIAAEVVNGCQVSVTKNWTVTDACGNTGTASQTITFTRDNTPPVINLTAAGTVNCNATPADVAAAFGTASVTDNCSTGLTATGTIAAEVVNGCQVSVTKNWTVTDACGNTGTASQTITFTRDNTPPVINLTAAGTVNCNATPADVAAAFGTASVTDNCSTGLTATGTIAAEVVNGCQVSVTKNWTVTDACGNTGTASQTITFTRDNTPPVINLTAAGTVNCNATPADVAAAFGTASVTDNCSTGLTATGTIAAEVVNGCQVSVTKNWTVTDACGNTGTASQTITFTRDNTPPVINLTAAGTVNCNATPADVAAAFGTASVTDNCSTGLTATGTIAAEVVNGCQVSVTKNWTVTDACGNTGTASQTITFTRDNTPPVINLTAAGTVNCNATPADVAAAFGTASVTDNCSTGLTATGTIAAEVVNGCQVSVTKNWTVTDACGNTGTASQTITFTRDNTPPVINLTAAGTVNCNATPADVAAAFGTASVTDNCSTGLTATGTIAAEVVNGCQVSVTKNWTVTDACGNTGTASQTITFTRDNTPPVINLTAAGTVNCNATPADVAAAFGTASVTDNCSTGLTATGTIAAEVVNGCQVSVTKNWTVTDACGNTGTASQTITFTRDNTPPELNCPTVKPICVDPIGNYIIPPLTASDNCSASNALTITYIITGATSRNGNGLDASGSFNVGVSIITWTVVDECGNSNTCTTEVKIIPKPTPTIYHN